MITKTIAITRKTEPDNLIVTKSRETWVLFTVVPLYSRELVIDIRERVSPDQSKH